MKINNGSKQKKQDDDQIFKMKVIILKMMNLIQLLQLWKLKLNQKFYKQFIHLTKEYNKLIKYQKEKLDCVLNSKKFSTSKEKNYKKIVDDILENIKSLTTITISIRRISSKTLFRK